MKLFTKEIMKKLEKSPYGSKGKQGVDAEVIVKIFNPYGSGTWLITEGEKQEDGDWLLYGYMEIGCWEWGTVMLSDLQGYTNRFGLGLERDLYSSGTVRELAG